MIRQLAPADDRRRRRARARRQWQRRLVLLAVVQIEGVGRALIVGRTLETRWSPSRRCRLWRLPQPDCTGTAQ